MPEGRRTLNVEQLTAGVPKREELPKLTKKQLAEHIYDFYIEINITDPKNGVGKDEWVRRMLNGGGGVPAAKKDELIRQLSSILEDRENDIHYINAVAGQHGLERLKSRVSLVDRFSRNTLETELDARDDTAIPDERNASLSAFSTSEIAEIVENYSAYKRPFTAQFLAEWEAAENGAIDYRAAVERVIDEEYKNRPNYLDAPKIAFIHSYFVRQREQELEYLDERQYQALWQSHLDGDCILECLSQEYETNFEGRLTSDEDVTRLIEQFTYAYYSDVLITRNEPFTGEELNAYIGKGLQQVEWLEGRSVLTEGEIDDVISDLKEWFEGSRFDTSATGDFDGWYDDFAEEKLMPLLKNRVMENPSDLPFFRETRYGSPVNGIAEVPVGSGKYVAIIDNSGQRENAFTDNYPPSFIIAHDYNPKSGEWHTGAFGFPHYEDAREYYKVNNNVDIGENAYSTMGRSSDNRSALRQAIQEEFAGFKAVEMKKSPEEIFSNMQKIHFFTEVTNFFSEETNFSHLSDAAVTGLLKDSPNTLSRLYDFYVKNKGIGIESPEQIQDIINGYAAQYFPAANVGADNSAGVEYVTEIDFFGTDEEGMTYYRLDSLNRDNLPQIDKGVGSIVAARENNVPQHILAEQNITFLQIGRDIKEEDFWYPANGLFTSAYIADRDTRKNMQVAALLKEPLYGVVYNWKGLKEENSVYTAAQLSAEDPDFNPALEQQDGAFAANKTYIVYKLNGATVEETAENVKAFMTGSKNYEAEQAPLIPGWYWETVNYNLFTGVVNPTVDTFVEHFGLSDEALRMQEQEELSPWSKLEAQTQELVKTTGKPHVLIEWSESGAVPDETIMTFEDADRLLSGLNSTYSDAGYYKTKLHIYYQDGDEIGIYADMRYDIGTERGGLVEHIEDFATNPLAAQAHFTNPEEQQELLGVVNILKEYMQGVYAAENLEKQVEAWREQNITLFTEGKIKEILPFPNYVSIPYNEFSAATGWGCSIEELVTWGKEHQKGTAEQKQWIVDYLEDINFHTETGLLSEGKYDEFEELIVQRRVEMKLDNIRADGASLKEIETRINLASKYTLEQLESEIDARTAYDAGRSPENLEVELHREMSDISNKDLYKTVEDYDAYSHKFAPVVLRVYKNFALPTAEELAAEMEQSAANEPKPLPVKQKQNIKTVLGGKYNADDLQKYLSKELEENALKNAQSEKEFLSFLASFRSRQYSVRNQLMLYIQAAQNDYMPIFGTFEEWKGKGTSIQPGTHGLTICRPIFTDVYYTVDVEADGEWVERRYRKFGLSEEKLKELEKRVKEGTARKETELTSFIYTDSVFSMSQTTMTEEQRIEYLQRYNAYNTSTENEGLYEKLKVIAAELGRPVVEKPIKGEELGWIERAENGTTVIKEDMPVDAKISVSTHEIGHKLLHIQNATAETRAQKEVQAQLFSHLAMLKLGIDAEKQFSLSYINNWLKAGEKDPPVFDADGRQLSKGEVLQLNLAAVIPAVDALLKTVGAKEQAIDTEALKELKDYKAEQKPQPEQRTSKKEGKVGIEPLKVLKETDKAVFVKIPGANPEDSKKGIWLPRSCISVNKEGYVYEATPTVIQEKGLTPKAALSATKGLRAQRILKI